MRTPRTAAPVAWAVAAGSLMVVSWATSVAVRDGLTWQQFVHEELGFSLVLVATMPVLGAFIVTRHPGQRLGWLFCLYGPLRGIEVLADVWANHTYEVAPGSWPGGPVASWLRFGGPLFLLPTAPLLVLWFPDGHAPPGRWRRVELASVLLVALLIAALALAWPFRGPRLLPETPDIHGWRGVAAEGSRGVAVLVVAIGFTAGVASLISRLRRAEPATRAQVKWFLFGVTATFALNVAGGVVNVLAPLRLVAVVVLEFFILVAVQRYRLWEIDRLINRTVVFGVLTAGAAVVYASAAIGIGLVVGDTGADSSISVAGATLLIAALFAPARGRIQLAVDRRFDRRTFDAVARIRAFADRLGHDAPDPPALQGLLADVLRDPDLALCFYSSNGELIDLSGATIIGPSNDEDRMVTVLGGPLDPIGVLGHRRSLGDDGRLLGDVLRSAGSLLEYARLQAELGVQLVAIQRSRVRLVEATDAERRRIERDLHDGAQQRLVALALRVRTEQHRRTVEPGGTIDRLLSATVEELQAAVADLRSMTHGLLPAGLATGGTAPALRELIARYDGNVRLASVPDHRHAEIVEATAWFVASEGLTNATKHAPDASVTVSAACDRAHLRVAICDNGPGGATFTGPGLRGLTDRVDACGGRLTLTTPTNGGTELIAVLPCA